MVNDVEDILLRRSRIAFLNDKNTTLNAIPIISRLLLQEKNRKLERK